MHEETKYKPINCELHDGFELACIRQAIHPVTWSVEGKEKTERLRFLDLEYSAEGEFLIAENEQQAQRKIRLDSITSTLPY